MNTVEEYCNDILMLKDGKTVLKGALKDIKVSYGRNNLSIKCHEDILNLAKSDNLELKTRINSNYEFKLKSDSQGYNFLKKLIDNKISIDKFEIREPSLHEIFIEKAGEKV